MVSKNVNFDPMALICHHCSLRWTVV